MAVGEIRDGYAGDGGHGGAAVPDGGHEGTTAEGCAIAIGEHDEVAGPEPGCDLAVRQVAGAEESGLQLQAGDAGVEGSAEGAIAAVAVAGAAADEGQAEGQAGGAQFGEAGEQGFEALAVIDEAEPGQQGFVRGQAVAAAPGGGVKVGGTLREDVAADGDERCAAGQGTQAGVVLVIGADDGGGAAGEMMQDVTAQGAGLWKKPGDAQVVEGCHQGDAGEGVGQEMDAGRHVEGGGLELEVDDFQAVMPGPAAQGGQRAQAPVGGDASEREFVTGGARATEDAQFVAEGGEAAGRGSGCRRRRRRSWAGIRR